MRKKHLCNACWTCRRASSGFWFYRKPSPAYTNRSDCTAHKLCHPVWSLPEAAFPVRTESLLPLRSLIYILLVWRDLIFYEHSTNQPVWLTGTYNCLYLRIFAVAFRSWGRRSGSRKTSSSKFRTFIFSSLLSSKSYKMKWIFLNFSFEGFSSMTPFLVTNLWKLKCMGPRPFPLQRFWLNWFGMGPCR